MDFETTKKEHPYCQGSTNEDQPCPCEAYDEPKVKDSTTPALCTECLHGKSKHRNSASRLLKPITLDTPFRQPSASPQDAETRVSSKPNSAATTYGDPYATSSSAEPYRDPLREILKTARAGEEVPGGKRKIFGGLPKATLQDANNELVGKYRPNDSQQNGGGTRFRVCFIEPLDVQEH
jgi:hypothetical protein